jgi:S1-C subfamily serine protease
VQLRGRSDARSTEGQVLPNALDLDWRGAAATLGTPVLDNAGTVVGMAVRACRGQDSADAGCAPALVAAPVAAIRSFLGSTPVNAVPPSPWLGIAGVPDSASGVSGVRVLAVAPQSPAEKAGLKPHNERDKADLIVMVDGQQVTSPEDLADRIGKHAVGETVKLRVLSIDRFRDLDVVLRAAP